MNFKSPLCLWVVACALLFEPGTLNAGRRPLVGGSLRIGVNQLPTHTDPARAHSRIALFTVGVVHARLFGLDAKGRPTLDLLAGAPARERNGKRWRCELRTGLRFHDGRALRSQDVAHSVERLSKGHHAWLARVLEVTVIDNRRFVIDLAHPFSRSELGRLLASPALSIVPKRNARRVGAGPFRVLQHSGDTIRLKAYNDHHAGRPYLDNIDLIVFDDVVAAFTYGKVDMVFEPSPRYKGAKTVKGPFRETLGILFHHRHQAAARGARAALWRDIPRNEIKARVPGVTRIASGLVPGGRSFKPGGVPSDGKGVSGVLACRDLQRQIAREVASSVRAKGHQLTVFPMSKKLFHDDRKSRWDAKLFYWSHGDLWAPGALKTLAAMAGLDPSGKAELELESTLLWVPIVDRALVAVHSRKIRGLRWRLDGSMTLADAWRISK